jgi:diaminopimelate decarboxylase
MTARDLSDLVKDWQTHGDRRPPSLSAERLQDFVRPYFDRRERYLDVLAHHPAPLYLLESEVLRSRAERMRRAFASRLPEVAFYFAVKSNNHPDVAGTLIAAGFGLDVSSGLELEMALELGAGDIVFSGPGKTMDELRLAVVQGERVTILMDSFGELERLGPLTTGREAPLRCGVRLTVDPSGLWRKFGIPLEDLAQFIEATRAYPNLRFAGIQFHTSWNLAPDPQITFLAALGRTLADLPPAVRTQIDFVDIGGGYWPEEGEWLQAAGTPEGRLRDALGQAPGAYDTHYYWPAAPIEAFAEALSPAIHEHLLSAAEGRICLEPGRWICHPAVQLLLTVVDRKAPDLVITDAGTNAVGWERFETDYFPVLNLSRPSLVERPCFILGSLCTPHDVWGYAYFGEDIRPGDILMIPSQGAYTYSLRQNFIKPLPKTHTI